MKAVHFLTRKMHFHAVGQSFSFFVQVTAYWLCHFLFLVVVHETALVRMRILSSKIYKIITNKLPVVHPFFNVNFQTESNERCLAIVSSFDEISAIFIFFFLLFLFLHIF
jgi:hypothetical protein